MKKIVLYYLIVLLLMFVAAIVADWIVINTLDPDTPFYSHYYCIGPVLVITQMPRLRRMFKLDKKKK